MAFEDADTAASRRLLEQLRDFVWAVCIKPHGGVSLVRWFGGFVHLYH
jgi:hypothetical protein